MKACPFCAEEIQDAAIVCRHCNREIAPTPAPAAPTAKGGGCGKALLIFAGLVVALFIGLVALGTLDLGSKGTGGSADHAPTVAKGDRARVVKGARLFPSLAAYSTYQSCVASRDYDNTTVAGRYGRDAETTGEVLRARQAAAYAAKQQQLECDAPGRVADQDLDVVVLGVGTPTITYEGLVPKIAAAKPQVVAITRNDTLYEFESGGARWWVSRVTKR